jgi:hypothetical protein
MIGGNQRLVTNELVEFENELVEVPDFKEVMEYTSI